MKKTKTLKSKQTKLYFCGVLTIIFILSVVGFKSYSFVMQKYREEKIMQQIQQHIESLSKLLETQNDYKTVNEKYYNSNWSVVAAKDTSSDKYQTICSPTNRYHNNGTQVIYCDYLLFGKDFVPDYAYTDYLTFPDIYGGDVFVLMGTKVCKSDEQQSDICAFIRFKDLPPDDCVKIATYDWLNHKADYVRINMFDTFFNSIFANDFSVDEDMSLWKKHISLSEAEEMCYKSNNWMDFMIYKD